MTPVWGFSIVFLEIVYFVFFQKYFIYQRRIQHQRRARTPLFDFFFWGGVFVNFDYITLILSNCSHHTMFTICTLFSSLTAKHRVCVKGHQNKPKTPRILPRRDRAPRVLKFLDPPLYFLM